MGLYSCSIGADGFTLYMAGCHRSPTDDQIRRMYTFDQTVVITPGQRTPQAPTKIEVQNEGPKLIEKGPAGDKVIELNKETIVFGKDDDVDVELNGLWIAKHHAEIVAENGEYRIRHLGGFRKVSVRGESIKEQVLENNDEIRIGKREFIFQE